MVSSTSTQKVQITVFGDVQAVGFRFTAIEVARGLGLTGWVRNNRDGSVQIVAEGQKEPLENLITWAKKGPPLARVDEIKTEWQEATGEFYEFQVSYQ
ncbi:MAG: hypothetical protein A2Z24_00220 [Candidatus Woykebacteria bacterium RBG_16_44_10]|uniref:acylphosphatase n=1 Tax=Candidatus Woykebacteria bacterium RBG_16_44_10 TaxID=1802597 RepID=A0A1G1WFU4_9BACT|nr:MAG: hypothetical protein A2Z24_00220 [Candidatus Woykebacteria bacterium RBG_16_44_10]